MEPIVVANIVGCTLFASAVGFAAAWMRARERAIRAELKSQSLPRDTEARFDRLQQAVEAMAVEVERIAEAQRYSAKLLTERAERSPVLERPRGPERVITPH